MQPEQIAAVLSDGEELTYEELKQRLGAGDELAKVLSDACRYGGPLIALRGNPPRYRRRRKS